MNNLSYTKRKPTCTISYFLYLGEEIAQIAYLKVIIWESNMP